MLKSSYFSMFGDSLNQMYEQSVSLMNHAIDNYKQLTYLQTELVKSMANQTASASKEICATKSPSDAANYMKDFIVASTEYQLNKTQELSQIWKKSQEYYSNMSVESLANLHESLSKSLANLNPSNAIIGSEIYSEITNLTVNAMKNFYENSNKFREATNIASQFKDNGFAQVKNTVNPVENTVEITK